MTEPLSGLATVLEIVTKLRSATKNIRDAELKGLIADLHLAVADLKLELAESRDESRMLRDQLRASQEMGRQLEGLEMRQGVLWRPEPTPGQSAGPFCTRCAETEKKIVPLMEMPSVMDILGTHKCGDCEQLFKVK